MSIAYSSRATPASRELSAEQQRFFAENGYLILRGFIAAPAIAAARARLDALWRACPPDLPTVIDTFIGTPRELRSYFRDAPPEARQHPYKISDLHMSDDAMRDLCADPRLMAAMSDVLGAPAVVMNTLLLEYGSQQDAHFDTFYMPSVTPNMMAAAWIALEAATEQNGPLFYYPKSHLIPPFRFSHGGVRAVASEYAAAAEHMRRVVADHGLERKVLLVEPGDILLWHAQLLHGGSAIADPTLTRLSLVTHYWTTLDVDRPEDRIELGDGRLLLRKKPPSIDGATRHAAVTRAEAEAFVGGLTTSPDDRAAVPAGFDPLGYLLQNPDVFAVRMDPFTHYRHHGRLEGRRW